MKSLTIALISLLLALVLSAPVVASGSGGCEEVDTVEGETLYYCESNFGPPCYWDPSPVLGAGVMDCGW